MVNEQIRPGGKASFDCDALAIRAQMKLSTSSTTSQQNGGEQEISNGGTQNNSNGIVSNHPNAHQWGRFDSSALHIQHALRATEVQRKYSKPIYDKPIEAYLVSN